MEPLTMGDKMNPSYSKLYKKHGTKLTCHWSKKDTWMKEKHTEKYHANLYLLTCIAYPKKKKKKPTKKQMVGDMWQERRGGGNRKSKKKTKILHYIIQNKIKNINKINSVKGKNIKYIQQISNIWVSIMKVITHKLFPL